ncbi:capsule assembly Wzi family protein [Parapedobacter defluvii]|uniref:capsule assembly Wzi family protein n=1 Tax=Parapedobacter defluvii TaxID=2045106 RepID=UPI000F968B8B|nr:MAG: hypothetical protein EAS52_03545 [Parapedobacter sp.]
MKNKLSLSFLLLSSIAFAQPADTLKLQVGTLATLSSKGYQPLWTTSNRFGLLSDEGADLATYAGIWNTHTFPAGKHDFRIEYGANIVNSHHFSQVIIQQGYVKARYGALEFRGGRFEEILGGIDPLLSTGSLGVSGNALPIPKIGFALPEYTPVPFTNGWLQVKGQISHGWMGNEQSMKRAWLHEKTFYAKLGNGPFKVYGGLQHFAIWGGERGDFKLDRSWKGFFDVLFVKEADDGSVGGEILPNRAGDQRGLIEFGGDLDLNDALWHLYFQVPFESGMGIDIRNIDRVGGLQVTLKNHNWLDRLVVEFIYTKQMEGFQKAELQSYYNNGVYASGWEYQYRSIGTPLFLNRYRGANFLPVEAVDWRKDNSAEWGNKNFINNRIVGGHIGMLHRYAPGITGRTMLTYTRNFGTHMSSNPITAMPRNQVYTLHEVSVALTRVPGLLLSAGVAVDAGGLYDNVGGLLGISYQLKGNKK